MIVPPILLAVVVGVVSVVVVVVFWLDSAPAHCLHLSRTRPLQDQHPAPDTSWQEEGMFSSRHCWQAAAPSCVVRLQHCALQFPSWDCSKASWEHVEPGSSLWGDREQGANTQPPPPETHLPRQNLLDLGQAEHGQLFEGSGRQNLEPELIMVGNVELPTFWWLQDERREQLKTRLETLSSSVWWADCQWEHHNILLHKSAKRQH